MNSRELTNEERRVIIDRGTEAPFSGRFCTHTEDGTYRCRQCDAPLYRSADKFDAHCGWPSFDDALPGAVRRIPDPDGRRTEITCAACGGHLGHVFLGEALTPKNVRHCVNSISLAFDPSDGPANESETNEQIRERALFASGCFWGTEYYLAQAFGVISTRVGYSGGKISNPTYAQVCVGDTGHAETVEVVFDPEQVSFEELTRLFFETHDPTQIDRQGPDIGTQYRSEIFYLSESQRLTAEKLISLLKDGGYQVATRVTRASGFWPAEEIHQDYYSNNGQSPYCHFRTRRF